MFSWFKKKDSDSEQPPASAPQPSTPGDEPEPKSNAMESASQPAAPPVSEPRKGGFFSRVVRGLFKTRETLVKRVRKAIGLRARLDQELLDEIEEILIQADVGVATTKKIIDDLRLNVSAGESSEAVMTQLRSSMRAILQRNERVFSVDIARKPYIVLVVGVNGTGKTTTIGKIAQKLIAEGKRVTLVAADTFRAAAIEQLSIWGERVGARVIR
ncbi:MAG: signal recognition particle receptor subunit alpha, partial [Candidatus Sumerlaeota bacterium]|nr:signal recognition particle receptor subunit alpha [Candidatus Sumerlaeota bacterium]